MKYSIEFSRTWLSTRLGGGFLVVLNEAKFHNQISKALKISICYNLRQNRLKPTMIILLGRVGKGVGRWGAQPEPTVIRASQKIPDTGSSQIYLQFQ